jgi:hypothetical protein
MFFKYASFTEGHIVSLLRACLENGCGSLRSCISPLQRKNCTPFLGKPVFLLAAARLVGNGHLQQSGIEKRVQDLVPKLGAVGPFGYFHQIADGSRFPALVQDFDLVPT